MPPIGTTVWPLILNIDAMICSVGAITKRAKIMASLYQNLGYGQAYACICNILKG